MRIKIGEFEIKALKQEEETKESFEISCRGPEVNFDGVVTEVIQEDDVLVLKGDIYQENE